MSRLRIAVGLILLAPGARARGEAPWAPAPGLRLRFEVQGGARHLGQLILEFSDAGKPPPMQRMEAGAVQRFLLRAAAHQFTAGRMDGREPVRRRLPRKSAAKAAARTLRIVLAESCPGKDAAAQLPLALWPLGLWHRAYVDEAVLAGAGAQELRIADAAVAGREPLRVDGETMNCERVTLRLQAQHQRAEVSLWYDRWGVLCAMASRSAALEVNYVRLKK